MAAHATRARMPRTSERAELHTETLVRGTPGRLRLETMGARRRIAAVLAGLRPAAPPDAAAASGAPPRRRAELAGGPAPWRDAALDRVQRARAEARAHARRRAELARLARSRTVARGAAAGAADRTRSGGRAHARYRAALAGRARGGAAADGRAAQRAVGRAALGRAARGRAPPHAEPAAGRLPQPAPQHAHLDAGVVPARGRAAQLGRRPGRVPVRPGPRDAAAPARHLGQDQLAAAPLPGHARRRLPRAQPAAPARRARAAARAARRLRRVGVLLRLRAGHAAVDQRDGAGDRGPGALARGGRARRAALRAPGAAGARGVRDAAARRRRGSRRGRPALRHVLVRADAADPQRRAAGDQRPARRRGARAQRARRAARARAATGRRGRRSAASTRAPGRSTRRRASESTLAYHQLTTGILAELCRRTERVAYCRAERRFARYETEPPRIGIAPLRGLWARRIAPLHFTLSKGSAVRVRVFGPRGLVLARDMQLGRGGHDLSWTPPSRGRFRVRVSARGPEGRLGSRAGPCGWCEPDRSRSAKRAARSRAGRRRSGWARPTRRGPRRSG